MTASIVYRRVIPIVMVIATIYVSSNVLALIACVLMNAVLCNIVTFRACFAGTPDDLLYNGRTAHMH